MKDFEKAEMQVIRFDGSIYNAPVTCEPFEPEPYSCPSDCTYDTPITSGL